MKINLIAPVKSNNPFGNECRLIEFLKTEEGKELNIDLITTDLRISNKELINLYGKYDATIVFKGEMLNPEIIHYLSRPTVLYFPDDILCYPVYERFIKYTGSAYDLVYTFDSEAVDIFYKLGCKKVKWLPSWTGKDMFFNKQLERDIDICFVGTMNPDRITMLNAIREAFPDKNLFFESNIYGDKYVEILNRSKIVVNLAQGKSGVSQRVFEASACGAMVATNYCKDIDKLFNSSEIQTWSELKYLIDLLKLYLDYNVERKIIADAGYDKTVNNHLVQHRFKQILSDIQSIIKLDAEACCTQQY